MNNKAHLKPKDYDSNGDIIPMSWKEEKGDLISREALKSTIIEICGKCSNIITKYENGVPDGNCAIQHILNMIDNAPTVELDEMTQDLIDKVNVNVGLAQPIKDDRPQGEWEKCQNDMFRCSKCRQADEVPTAMGAPIYNFCPNCGAKMKGEK